MINFATLPGKIRPYRVTVDTELPWAYQRANPNGRPLHDDWAIPFLRGIPRINTAFRVPLPFRKKAGNAEPIWVPIIRPELWTFAPEAQVKEAPFNWIDPQTGAYKSATVKWVLTMDMVHPGGQWSTQECYLNGVWTECYRTSSEYHWIPNAGDIVLPNGTVIKNRRKVIYYAGLKLDCNPTDLMAWFPEASFSIKGKGIV